jgi:arylsulfatase A-like enzyme/Flp pilus assembly protein TadD
MKRTVRAAGPVIALCGSLLALAAGAAGADLNVLVVTIDTLRPDRLSCYSPAHLRTPVIDALAAKGVLFERAFAHDPETLPSHTNIFLGLTSLAHGVCENSKSVVDPGFLTLAELLKGHGYATGAFVSAFPLDSRFGLAQGFDVYNDNYPAKAPPGELIPERRAKNTVQVAQHWLSAQKGKWFCWVHLWDPHDPYSPPEPFKTQYRDDPYSGEVAYVDSQLGVLFRELEKRKVLDKTLIILTGDHAESLGEHGEKRHGYFAYNSTMWVPLVIVAPRIKAGRVRDYVSHVDIFPTVCDLVGLKGPPDLHGESLVPLLRGRTRPARPIYFEALEAYLNRGWAPLRGIIENGIKYIDSPIPEVYDLEKDFNEERNLAEAENLPAFQKRLREIMARGASSLAERSRRSTTDSETLERLRSLGYAASRMVQIKSSYGPEDDLKTLLPLENQADLAVELREKGRIAESVRLLEDIIKERADFTRAYDQLYEIYRSMGLVDEALEVRERGSLANPDNVIFHSEYGVALVMHGVLPKGAEVLEKALGLFDQDPRVWNSLGVAYGNMGDIEKALEHFGRALDLAPEDAILNENVGLFHLTVSMAMKDPDWARRSVPYFEQALATDPYLASAYNGLAGALRLLDRRDEAIMNWEIAAVLSPKFDTPLYNLILAYLEKGEKAKARECIEEYLHAKGSSISPEERQEMNLLIQKCRLDS